MNFTIARIAGLAVSSVFIGPDKMPDPWKDPGFNKILFVEGPHRDARPKDMVVDTVVVHATVSPTLEGTTKWFMNPESKVSAHYTIGKDGSIMQHVSTFERAWHAGKSVDKEGREGVNSFSIGIELVNLNDGKDPYTRPQVEALYNIIAVMKRRFPIKYITSHEYIAVPKGRKSDPKGFPWAALDPLGLEIVR
ncbi:MAG TPA: N-acetylmuramoyl-L-alanine amidase [Fimbriimonadaceae bacterium]|nr:N-acetylmuramoyl-L-alanine amidase [Fimbriimonadaceae bacterium]